MAVGRSAFLDDFQGSFLRGELIGDVSTSRAILHRLLGRTEEIQITGKNHILKDKVCSGKGERDKVDSRSESNGRL